MINAMGTPACTFKQLWDNVPILCLVSRASESAPPPQFVLEYFVKVSHDFGSSIYQVVQTITL